MEQIYRLIPTLRKEFEKDNEFAILASYPLPKLMEYNIPQIQFTPMETNLQIEEVNDDEF